MELSVGLSVLSSKEELSELVVSEVGEETELSFGCVQPTNKPQRTARSRQERPFFIRIILSYFCLWLKYSINGGTCQQSVRALATHYQKNEVFFLTKIIFLRIIIAVR